MTLTWARTVAIDIMRAIDIIITGHISVKGVKRAREFDRLGFTQVDVP